MGYILSSSTLTFKAYLTQKGRELYFNGGDDDILTNYFSVGDSDTNYFVSSNSNNMIKSGFVPNITGIEDECINTISKGVDIKYLIKLGYYQKGAVISQYCQLPNTLVEEISNGDGTSYFRETPNSISCGFYYNSNVFSRSFTKNSCTGSSIGQNYIVTTTYGQFTGTTQDIADNKALTYINDNGQQIANDNGTCMYSNGLQTMQFTKNNCVNGGNIYIVSANTGTFTSFISSADANNKAITYLTNNGQQIANDNGTCKTIVGTSNILLYDSDGYNLGVPNNLKNDINQTTFLNTTKNVNQDYVITGTNTRYPPTIPVNGITSYKIVLNINNTDLIGRNLQIIYSRVVPSQNPIIFDKTINIINASSNILLEELISANKNDYHYYGFSLKIYEVVNIY